MMGMLRQDTCLRKSKEGSGEKVNFTPQLFIHLVDHKKPETYPIIKRINKNKNANTYEEEQHLKNLEHMNRRIKTIGNCPPTILTFTNRVLPAAEEEHPRPLSQPKQVLQGCGRGKRRIHPEIRQKSGKFLLGLCNSTLLERRRQDQRQNREDV